MKDRKLGRSGGRSEEMRGNSGRMNMIKNLMYICEIL